MAVDHLMGDDAATLEDPVTFAISVALCLGLAALVFRSLLPATKAETAPKRAFALSTLALVGGPLLFWLGLPFVLAGGGIALGLRDAVRRRLALAAVVLGLVVIVVGFVGYGIQLVDKLV